MPKKKVEPIQKPRGTQDILPAEQKYWEYVVDTATAFARGFGFQRIDTPMFEEKALFERGVGEGTDIVTKEMFELKSRGGNPQMVLRPEVTSAFARAYIEHGMRSWPKPVKLFTTGSYFRYERPQAGRLREHHQFGMEVFASTAPITDVQLLYVLHLLFQNLGLEDYTLQINSLGEFDERKAYIKSLKEHYRRHRTKLCRDCKERLKTNPLRVLDCKEEKCSQVAAGAPQLLDSLGNDSKNRFDAVVKGLGELDVPFEINPHLVRGLDYYQHTVFEFVPKAREEDEAPKSFASGGRYDGLVKLLGGKDTPGIGVGIGLERVVDQLKEEGVELTVTDEPKVFIAHLGKQAKIEGLKLAHDLQQAGVPFAEALDRDGMQAQLKLADRLHIPWAIILGHKEVIDKTVILRNMESGMQEVVPREGLGEELLKRITGDV